MPSRLEADVFYWTGLLPEQYAAHQLSLWGNEQESAHPREPKGTVGAKHGGEFAKKSATHTGMPIEKSATMPNTTSGGPVQERRGAKMGNQPTYRDLWVEYADGRHEDHRVDAGRFDRFAADFVARGDVDFVAEYSIGQDGVDRDGTPNKFVGQTVLKGSQDGSDKLKLFAQENLF